MQDPAFSGEAAVDGDGVSAGQRRVLLSASRHARHGAGVPAAERRRNDAHVRPVSPPGHPATRPHCRTVHPATPRPHCRTVRPATPGHTVHPATQSHDSSTVCYSTDTIYYQGRRHGFLVGRIVAVWLTYSKNVNNRKRHHFGPLHSRIWGDVPS